MVALAPQLREQLRLGLPSSIHKGEVITPTTPDSAGLAVAVADYNMNNTNNMNNVIRFSSSERGVALCVRMGLHLEALGTLCKAHVLEHTLYASYELYGFKGEKGGYSLKTDERGSWMEALGQAVILLQVSLSLSQGQVEAQV